MKLSIHTPMLIAALVVTSAVTAQAQVVTTSQLLDRNDRCDHVIGLVMRHGVNNSVDRAGAHSLLHPSPYGGMAIPPGELGDLQIVQVNQLEHADPACGPKIAVTVRNASCRQVRHFHVTVVGVLGRIFPTSPSATTRIDCLEPGADIEVILPLPIEALAMGNRNGQVIGLQTLVVAIDSFDQLVETNEANNLQAFDITQLPMVAATVEETVETTTTETAVAETTVSEQATRIDTTTAQPVAEDPLRSAIDQLVPEENNQADAG